MSKYCLERKYGNKYKKFEKAEKPLMGMRMMWCCVCWQQKIKENVYKRKFGSQKM